MKQTLPKWKEKELIIGGMPIGPQMALDTKKDATPVNKANTNLFSNKTPSSTGPQYLQIYLIGGYMQMHMEGSDRWDANHTKGVLVASYLFALFREELKQSYILPKTNFHR